jgi:hypothetical protein
MRFWIGFRMKRKRMGLYTSLTPVISFNANKYWDGPTSRGLPHGNGYVHCDDGSYYCAYDMGVPHFPYNDWEEHGICYVGDGIKFKGRIVQGVPQEGWVKAGDFEFEGDFENGKASQGTMFYPNGAQWTGNFDNDTEHCRRQGWGIMVYADGSQVEGVWLNDEITDGSVKIILPSGAVIPTVLRGGYTDVYCGEWGVKELSSHGTNINVI